MEFAEHRFFLSEWAVNLSPGGMFVRSEAPMSPGQRFHFDAGLTAKGPRFEGVGEVMWVRTSWEGNARPPGFAVRFLELEDDGRAMMVRLAGIFLERGVGAMQEELQAMSAAWQRRQLDEENTDEIRAVEEATGPLPDTAVIAAPWALGLADEVERGTLDDAAAAAPEPTSEGAAERTVTAPLAVEPPAEPPAAGTSPPSPGRRRVWWVGVLGLALLGGSGYLVARGSLPGRLAADDDRAAAAAAVMPAMPAAAPASARALVTPSVFAGLDGVRWIAEGDGLWVVLELDGELPAGSLQQNRPDEQPPRAVVRLLGARRDYPRAVTPVHLPQLEQIRVAMHPAATSDGGATEGGSAAVDELWVVLDLASPDVVVQPAVAEGRSVRLLLTRENGGAPALAPAAAASPATMTQ